ncbi:major pollen allergen Ole e 10-like [Actinidia eriantha]|uniref:major pollen allergen Ole e 10-like n=1 Tax=Actinidia eriantha TaxID=165200 RepID=UPI00258C3328|nr:major pollen allergen Ole e 10-like [Actinidia eriantha]
MVIAKPSLAFVTLSLSLFLCFSGCTESLVVGREGRKVGQRVFEGAKNMLTKPQIQNHEPNEVAVNNKKGDPLPLEKAASTSVPNQKQWCVVMPSASAAQLDNNIQFCCNVPKVDCKAIQPGGMCYNYGTNKASDASVVMNLYFQVAGKKYPSCYFNGSGLIVTRDPSVGDCKFQA